MYAHWYLTSILNHHKTGERNPVYIHLQVKEVLMVAPSSSPAYQKKQKRAKHE